MVISGFPTNIAFLSTVADLVDAYFDNNNNNDDDISIFGSDIQNIAYHLDVMYVFVLIL